MKRKNKNDYINCIYMNNSYTHDAKSYGEKELV